MSNLPEFTAYEINELTKRARTSEYYARCLEFLRQTVLGEMTDDEFRSEKEIRWLWGIKRDLKEE